MQIKRLFPCVLSASVALGMLSSSNAFALGLGDIEVHSSLNQPLEAEIKLFSLEKGEFETLSVKLASPELFLRKDIDRLPVLSKLEFETTYINDVPYINVRSDEPIIEPFLDFLVEVNWNRGRLIREYTLLLDPPDLTAEKPAPVTAPVVTHTIPPKPRVSAESDSKYGNVSRDGDSITYGATKRNDTLWKIALKVRPDSSVSVFQVMMALLKANPEAFYHNNINSLKAGYILRLDDVALLTAISKKQALEEFRMQNQQWQAIKQGKAQAAGKSGYVPDDSSDGGGVAETSDAVTTVVTEKQPTARLELTVPDDELLGQFGSSATELVANVDKLQQDLVTALKNNETTAQENVLLQSRLNELETQINELKRLLTIESETLSNLQNREIDSVVTNTLAEAEPSPKSPAAAEQQKVTPAPAAQPQIDKEKAESETFISGLLKDPVALGLVVAVALGLFALGAIVMRRRARDDESFEDDNYAELAKTLPLADEGTVTDNSSVKPGASPVGGSEAPVVETVEPAVDQNETVEEDMQLDYEIDPIDEADVYIAYRRYPQAEDLLKEAIQIDPERNELYVKLLEIYAATGDQDAFIAQAKLLKESLKEGEEHLWSDVASLASEVCPGHPLFHDGEQVTLKQEDDAARLISFDADALDESVSSSVLSDEIDLTGGEKIFEEELTVAEKPSPRKTAPSESRAEPEDDNSIAFEDGLGAGLAPLIKNTEDHAGADDISLSDGDTDDGGDKNESLLEERMRNLTEELQQETADAGDSKKEESLESIDVIADDFLIPDSSLTDDDSSDDDWLAKMDEIGTRLDLARAYIDMGDEAGAREILDDVMEKGDDQQKKDALHLMQQLS